MLYLSLMMFLGQILPFFLLLSHLVAVIAGNTVLLGQSLVLVVWAEGTEGER